MHPLLPDYETFLVHEEGHSPRTIARYVGVVAEFCRYHASAEGADGPSVTASERRHVARYLRWRSRQAKVSSAFMWNLRLAALRSFFAHLVAEGHMAKNPAASIPRRRLPQHEPVWLSLDEMLRLVEATERASPPALRARNVAIVQTFFHASPRVSELAALTVAMLDLEKPAFLGVPIKGGNTRTIDCNDVVVEALEQYLPERDRLAAPNCDALFVSTRGTRLSVRAIQHLIGRYASLAGVPAKMSPHDLRHGSLTTMASEGVPVPAIQEQAGHKDIKTTRLYIHVTEVERHRAVSTLGKAYRRALARRARRSRREPPEACLA